MGALNDIDLLTGSCNLLLPFIEEREAEALEILSHSGSTVAVNSLRGLRVQKTTIVVGMFSIYEAVLQDEFGFGNYAFRELKKIVSDAGESEISDTFESYQLAINVLKHGKGSSYEQLLTLVPNLEFKVRGDGSDFDEEGDVTDGQFLIQVDSSFVRRCAEVIEGSLAALRDAVKQR